MNEQRDIGHRTSDSGLRTPNTERTVVLIVATLSSFLTPFMSSSVNVALPVIGQEFSADAILLSWIATVFLLAAAISLVPFGKIADIYGRKRVFTIGIALYVLTSFLAAVAPSIGWLIGVRVLQGIGGAMIFATGVAMLTSAFPASERGRVLGWNVAATYLGLSLGPVLGGILTEQFGWRSIFLVNVPLGLLAVALVLWKLRGEWAEARGERFDLLGSVVYGLALAAVMFGLSRLPAPLGGGLILLGIVGIAAFVWRETRVTSPVLNVEFFRHNTIFAMSNLAALINYSATSAVTLLLSMYLQYIQGLSPQNAGFVLVAQPAMMALFSPLAGRLSDRIESRVIASAGMGLTVVGLVLLTLVRQETGLGFIVASLLLLGLGFALFSSPNTNAIMSSVERKFYGVASATLGTMRLTGQMLSYGIAMLIFSLVVGPVQITPEVYPLFLTSVKTAFTVFAVLCFGGIFASLARGNMR